MPERLALVLTCEHGGNRIPRPWQALFRGQRPRLDSHQGYDRGALECARVLARRLRAPLVYADISRLLIDLNRSPHHRGLYSDITRRLPPQERRTILERHYAPHRRRVEQLIDRHIRSGRRVLHVAVHSFTPILEGKVRDADIALLYDPGRRLESALCRGWRHALRSDGEFTVRSNYPYRGVSDGLTRHLRTRFPTARYAGVELEINQRLLGRKRTVDSLQTLLASTLRDLLRHPPA